MFYIFVSFWCNYTEFCSCSNRLSIEVDLPGKVERALNCEGHAHNFYFHDYCSDSYLK